MLKFRWKNDTEMFPQRSSHGWRRMGRSDLSPVRIRSLSGCVEIIAKEGRSLKELYLVSCKITDHERVSAKEL
ncbi:F-box/LRR-repeat protein 17 [Triplophysa tibetana]|uniref:F-box/LRR-repeat protein 17 n=1 Tax=Triplophysa tibetana TaxID=1572043 RepID=A0A5A9NXY6_9TELE|nr:F-box/LRR-repeat protein 17 [Triplophysa tibetana]